ncbi:MAG: 30S ribosome-binding factor RbfA [Planctomycetota bacterium]|jgi:ribosome-binding factor A
MSRRTERVGSLLRSTIADVLFRHIADPRIDPARTSVTRVEVPEDLLTAKVYVSVMGEPAEQRRTLEALRHAAGRIQDLMMRQVSLRHTPTLVFVLDEQFKKTMATLSLIQQAMDEIHEKEAAAEAGSDDADRGEQMQESSE